MSVLHMESVYLFGLLVAIVFIVALVLGRADQIQTRPLAKVRVRTREAQNKRIPPEESTPTINLVDWFIGLLLLAYLITILMNS